MMTDIRSAAGGLDDFALLLSMAVKPPLKVRASVSKERIATLGAKAFFDRRG
jgi:hypothetical protein